MNRLGVDIGGTKIAAGVVDDAGRILARFRRETPRTGRGSDVMAEVVDLIGEVSTRYALAAIGLGAKGVIDTVNGIVLQDGDTLPGWGGTDVAGPVRAAHGLPVAVDNDVRVTALGEARHGAGVGFDRLLVASIGTGVGGGLVFDGEIAHGAHGTAGEIAHLLVPGPGALPCGCGRWDHLEAVAAGPAIAAEYSRRSGRRDVRLTEVADLMHGGDELARETIADAGRVLGAALAGLATAIDVDAVVVGGGVAQIGDAFLGPTRSAFLDAVLEPLERVPVVVAALGNDAPIVGAAELVAGIRDETGVIGQGA
ncbi:ROK family protein [Nakamurella lactea]|uniref:ROK family protein n=1 Tax=Nakamurella lactea TaxID=459515 RepID=UPI0004109AA6|nr:ROK family protein [Nakamurella lactea]